MEVGKFLLVLFTFYCFSIISLVENKTYLLVKHQDNGGKYYEISKDNFFICKKIVWVFDKTAFLIFYFLDDSYASTEPTKGEKTPNSSGYRTQDISKQTKHKLQKFHGHKFLSRDETKLISGYKYWFLYHAFAILPN